MSLLSKETSIEIELIRGELGLGFNIRGGTDLPHIPGDNGIFVTKVKEGGAAHVDGRLKEGDKILSVNGLSIVGVKHEEAVRLFRSSGNRVKLRVIKEAEQKIAKALQQQKSDLSGSFRPYAKWALVAGVLALAAALALRKWRGSSGMKALGW